MRYGVEVSVKQESIRSVIVEASSEGEARRAAMRMVEDRGLAAVGVLRVKAMPTPEPMSNGE